MDELRRSGDGSLTLGLIPKISIDARIRCQTLLPEPPLPTQRYVEIACRAASKIIATTWPFRQHVEVIKVGYILSRHSSVDIRIFGEVVIVVPTIVEKVVARSEAQISGHDWARRKTISIGLTGPDEEYESILSRLSEEVASRSYKVIREKQDLLRTHIEEILGFQSAFEQET